MNKRDAMSILMLDLDGTVRQTISGKKFINEPNDQEVIPEAKIAIDRYKDYKIFGITNQEGVASGYKSLESAIAEQQKTLQLVPEMEYILFCPDLEGATCYQVTRKHCLLVADSRKAIAEKLEISPQWNYRKPGAGMLNHILLCDLDLSNKEKEDCSILYVGDREEDYLAAEMAGVPFLTASEWWRGESL